MANANPTDVPVTLLRLRTARTHLCHVLGVLSCAANEDGSTQLDDIKAAIRVAHSIAANVADELDRWDMGFEKDSNPQASYVSESGYST